MSGACTNTLRNINLLNCWQLLFVHYTSQRNFLSLWLTPSSKCLLSIQYLLSSPVSKVCDLPWWYILLWKVVRVLEYLPAANFVDRSLKLRTRVSFYSSISTLLCHSELVTRLTLSDSLNRVIEFHGWISWICHFLYALIGTNSVTDNIVIVVEDTISFTRLNKAPNSSRYNPLVMVWFI